MKSSEKKLIQKAIDREVQLGNTHKDIFQTLGKKFKEKDELFEQLSKSSSFSF